MAHSHPPPMLPQPPEGAVALVDKPQGPTSHDVVGRLRRVFGMKRVGHAGTLDPMATGLLVAAAGPATRLFQFLTGLDKEYEGEITLGGVSDTYDATGQIEPCAGGGAWPGREDVLRAMNLLVGSLEQRPPAYSAVRSGGRRLYDFARRGETVPETAARRVKVYSFDLMDYAPPALAFRCRVSSGTYVRSLAHDLGAALGRGGYLSSLRRVTVGPFHVRDAAPIEAFESGTEAARLALLRPAEGLPHLGQIVVGAAGAARIGHGGGFGSAEIEKIVREFGAEKTVTALDSDGRLLAVCAAPSGGGLFRPLCVFPPES